MKKKTLITLTALVALSAGAQVKLSTWLNNMKLSGYGMTQYQYSSQEGAQANSFNIRLLRLSLDGRIVNDFYWKAQLQLNGNTTTLGNSPRVVDLFAEWQKLECFRVKLGQFKRPFTFENPMHPIDQGFMGNGQNIVKLAGFNDRSGAHSSNGRDLGLQIQGDFLKNSAGRTLLHYQIGIFNGQGINTKDVDQQKDIIGGLWIKPLAGMRIGAFGWTGSYARKGTWDVVDANHQPVKTVNAEGKTVTLTQWGVRSLRQHRYALSAEYTSDDWTFRSEYIHSTGYAFTQQYQTPANATNANIDYNAGNKADGIYALAIAPVIKNRLHAKARYDMYRPSAEWNKAKTLYEVGIDYEFTRSLKLCGEYALVNDRSLPAGSNNYSIIDVQVDFRF